ncbi:MAG: efflux RND transporter permease subunit [Pseudomonadales bacterium]
MDIFVRRPVLAVVISLTFLLVGLFATFKIPVLQFPKIENSAVIINTAYPGASAEVVQGFVTDPIERVASTIPGVDFVDSNTTAGTSTVTAWLDLNVSSTDALAELTARLNEIRSDLPLAAKDPAIQVQRTDRPYAVIYLSAISDRLSRAELTDYLVREVNPLLSSIDGVQRISLEGGRNPAMRVWINPLKMSALNLAADDVLSALRNNNVLAAIGRTENDQQRINLLSNATLQTVQDFENLVVREVNGSLIRLSDIARVELGEDRGEDEARFNKQQTIYVAVWPLPGANEIDIGDEVYKRVEKINASMPQGMALVMAYDGTLYMRNALKEIFTTLFETVGLVGLVVLVMMGAVRTALVPLVTIPISILGSIAAMAVMGFTLNLLTVLAVVLSVGLVVDDAIVVVENVARHMREGHSRVRAALESSRELLSPIIAMTITLAAVYAPIGFVSGLTGALFKEFAFTLAIAVIISGIVAITLSPIMSAYVCADQGKESAMTRRVNDVFDRLRAFYGRLVKRQMDWQPQILVIGFVIALLMVPMYLFSSKELAPVEDQGGMIMVVQSQPEASLGYTTGYMEQVYRQVDDTPGLNAIWELMSPNSGFGGFEFVDYAERDFSVQEIQPEIYGKLWQVGGIQVLPILWSPLPTAGQFDVEFIVKSSDSYENMERFARQLIWAGLGSNQFLYLETDLKVDMPQARLKLDHDRIADLGMDVEGVSSQLAALISEQDVNRFNANGKSYPVIPMVENAARNQPETLLQLHLRTPSGQLVPVSAFATIERETGPRVLGKFNQQKSFRIFGGVVPGVTKDQALTTIEKLAGNILPKSYTVDYAGESRQIRKEGNSMINVLLISLCAVYLVLVVQFNSFRSALVVLVGSVPLALSGALLFTYFEFTTINIYAQIGFITLVGLVAKNGILITEFANSLQRQGLAKIDAITQAAQTRLRPVLMTTAATILGHFPLVLVTGAGAEARNSIGIILVAGMFIGTLFTLFVLPSVYLWLAGNYKPVTASESEAAVPVQSTHF